MNGLNLINILMSEKRMMNPSFSHRALAKEVGISQSLLIRLLKGERNLTAAQAYKIGTYAKLNRESMLDLLVTTIHSDKITISAR